MCFDIGYGTCWLTISGVICGEPAITMTRNWNTLNECNNYYDRWIDGPKCSFWTKGWPRPLFGEISESGNQTPGPSTAGIFPKFGRSVLFLWRWPGRFSMPPIFVFFFLPTFCHFVTHVFSGSLLRRVCRALAGSGTLVEMLWGWGAKSEPRAQFLDVGWMKRTGWNWQCSRSW